MSDNCEHDPVGRSIVEMQREIERLLTENEQIRKGEPTPITTHYAFAIGQIDRMWKYANELDYESREQIHAFRLLALAGIKRCEECGGSQMHRHKPAGTLP